MSEAESVTGGNRRRVQVRKAVRAAFTAAKRQVFLDHLAACCNVTRSAAAAGAGISTVYGARRSDPAFARAWDEAIEAGYATLEALLIERAALGGHGDEAGGYVPGDTPVPGPETIDTWLALDLLRMSRAPKAPRKASGPPPRRATEKALAEKILGKLDVLAQRKRRGAAGRPEGQALTPALARKREREKARGR
jgi:hypothetical protein